LAKADFSLTRENVGRVVDICRRLDGMPLAIELAASRVKVLSPLQISQKLDDHLRLLTGGARTALERQQTLRASIDWSYRMLTDTEQAALRGFSAFVGGADFEAVAAVCDADELDVLDTVASLVDKSLLEVDEWGDKVRYRMLETIRQYAREKLQDAGEAEAVRRRHLDHFAEYAERYALFTTHREPMPFVERIDALEREVDNIRTALAWGAEEDSGQRLATASFDLWLHRIGPTEAVSWLERVLQVAEPGDTRGRALNALGELHAYGIISQRAADYFREAVGLAGQGFGQGSAWAALAHTDLALVGGAETERTQALAERGLVLAREAGYGPATANALLALGMLAGPADGARARALYEEAAEVPNAEQYSSWAARSLAQMLMRDGDIYGARRHIGEYIAAMRRMRTNQVIGGLNLLGYLEIFSGEIDAARRTFEEGLEMTRRGGSAYRASILHSMGDLELFAGNPTGAKKRFEDAIDASKQSGDDRAFLECLYSLAAVASDEGDAKEAVRLSTAAVEVQQRQGKLVGRPVRKLAQALIRAGRLHDAAVCLGAWEAWAEQIGAGGLPGLDQWRFDLDLATLRAELGEQMHRLWDEGRQLSLEQAIARVLGTDES
jgi:predicted ATPase